MSIVIRVLFRFAVCECLGWWYCSGVWGRRRGNLFYVCCCWLEELSVVDKLVVGCWLFESVVWEEEEETVEVM